MHLKTSAIFNRDSFEYRLAFFRISFTLLPTIPWAHVIAENLFIALTRSIVPSLNSILYINLSAKAVKHDLILSMGLLKLPKQSLYSILRIL